MKEKDQILFENYLTGTLSESEQVAFEKRLGQESGFKEDWLLYKALNIHVAERVENKSALENLRSVHSKHINQSKLKTRWYFVFGLILLLSGLVLFSITKKKELPTEKLLAEYQFPPNMGTRSLKPNTTSLDSAVYYFDLRRFHESVTIFKEILKEDPQNNLAHKYLAHNYFHLKELDLSKFHSNKNQQKDRKDSLLHKILMDLR